LNFDKINFQQFFFIFISFSFADSKNIIFFASHFGKRFLVKKAVEKQKKFFENLVDYKNEVFLQSQN
jgi:hypothetical protein